MSAPAVPQSPTFLAAEELRDLMVARATSEPHVSKADYIGARQALLADRAVADLVPRFVRNCHSPDAFWSYIRGVASGSGSWDARRRHIYESFAPLLASLERFDIVPVDDPVGKAVAKFDAASVSDAWTKALERRGRDPAGAITAARTLLESVCKSILDDLGHPPGEAPYTDRDDLSTLYKRLSKRLRLSPAD